MKTILLSCLLGELLGAYVFAAEPETFIFSRKVSVQVCDEKNICERKDTGMPETKTIELKKFHKGNARGLHGEDRGTVMVEGVPFKSEIFVNKIKNEYSVYLVLRSGKSRRGSTKKIQLNDLKDFSPILLSDKSYTSGRKKLRAELSLSAVK